MNRKIQAETKKILKKAASTVTSRQIAKLAFLAFFTSGLLIFIGFHYAYRDKIYPGVSVGGIQIGNQTTAEANRTIETIINFENQKLLLLLETDQRQWFLNPREIKLTYNSLKTAQKAYRIGRSGHWLQDLITKSRAWSDGIEIGLEYHFDQQSLESKINEIAAQIYTPALDPQLIVTEQQIVAQQGREGLELNRQKLTTLLIHRLVNRDFSVLKLPVTKISPLVSPSQLEATRQRAEKITRYQLILTFKDNRWEFSREELAQMVAFNGGYHQEKIASQAAELAPRVNRPVQNPVFHFENGRVTQFKPAETGLNLNLGQTQMMIQKALKEMENSPLLTIGESNLKVIELPVENISPEMTVDRINNLGINELLGRGVSYYSGSIASRIHNLLLASEKLSGILVPPGETFSFNQSLGEVSPATGFQSAFVIKEGRTILDDGGGVCQASTTLFRAILEAGLPVIERHAHSYRVSYYEQGGFGPGLDATVWIPNVDLKFSNDTGHHILIQSWADRSNAKLVFELYGTSDGRQITISKAKYLSQSSPPPDLYQDDPGLPAGTIKQIERAIPGAKVSVDWKVTRGQEVLQNKTFYSVYQPWQAIYLQGTGPAQ